MPNRAKGQRLYQRKTTGAPLLGKSAGARIAFSCPKCGAPPGHSCRTTPGSYRGHVGYSKPLKRPHAERGGKGYKR